MPATFASLLRREHVFTDVPPLERDEVFRVVLDRLVSAGIMTGEASTTVLRAILKRERTGTTGIGRGIAIPHCKTTAVDEPLVALARPIESIAYGAADGDPVHSIFLVVSPPDLSGAHVAILRSVARIARDDYSARVLRNTREAGSLFDLIQELEGPAVSTEPPPAAAAADVVVRNPQGLHLRPATEFAKLVLTSGCQVKVEVDGVEADGASVLELAMLGVVQGTTLRISAEGPGADAAIQALVALVAGGFSER